MTDSVFVDILWMVYIFLVGFFAGTALQIIIEDKRKISHLTNMRSSKM